MADWARGIIGACVDRCVLFPRREGTNFSLKQITTNIYFEKQTQAVNLHFD